MPGIDKLRDTGCPIAFALDTFGDRWTLIVIRDMLMKGYQTFGEFLGSKEKIATNVLTDRLRQLEEADIVSKTRDPDNRRKYRYRLTEKGADLTPIILEMIRWSAKYDNNTIVTDEVLARIENDRDDFAKQLRNRAISPD